jgi:hypothetical protein
VYAFSHSGLGDDSTSVDTSGIDLTSGVVVIGAIALLSIFLIGYGPKYEAQGGKKKTKKRKRGFGSTRTIYRKARASGESSEQARDDVREAKEEKDDLRQEVIDGLMGQGATKAQATKAVRASKGSDFDTLFKNSINKIRGLEAA